MLLNIAASHANPDTMGQLRQSLAREGFQSASSVELKAGLKSLITRVVDSLSVIAFGALLIASLGVANMVIASVHARRFEFGVLRAIGAARGQLIRLVLAEVTLIGLVAGVLGAARGCNSRSWPRWLIACSWDSPPTSSRSTFPTSSNTSASTFSRPSSLPPL